MDRLHALFKKRGLTRAEQFVSEKCLGLVESPVVFYPKAKWQRFTVHFYRDVFSVVPKLKVKNVATMLKAIHPQEDRAAAEEKVIAVAKNLRSMKLSKVAQLVEQEAAKTESTPK